MALLITKNHSSSCGSIILFKRAINRQLNPARRRWAPRFAWLFLNFLRSTHHSSLNCHRFPFDNSFRREAFYVSHSIQIAAQKTFGSIDGRQRLLVCNLIAGIPDTPRNQQDIIKG
jgi:hypothetical protein